MEEIFAYQTWRSGGLQVSSLYYGAEARLFIERHYESNTFADLHVFNNEQEANFAYNEVLEALEIQKMALEAQYAR